MLIPHPFWGDRKAAPPRPALTALQLPTSSPLKANLPDPSPASSAGLPASEGEVPSGDTTRQLGVLQRESQQPEEKVYSKHTQHLKDTYLCAYVYIQACPCAHTTHTHTQEQ